MKGNVTMDIARGTTAVAQAERAIAVVMIGLTAVGQNTMTSTGAIETNIGRTMECTVTDPPEMTVGGTTGQ